MAFYPTSRKFYDVFTGTGGGGTTTLNSCQGDKVLCKIEGYYFWATENEHLVFDAATQTITFYGILLDSTDNFEVDGFKVDDTFDVVGTGSNDGSYTIASIEGRTITTVEPLVNEDAANCSLYGTTLITAMDFYFNLIENSSTDQTFASAIDTGTIQRYTINDLDAADTTPKYMLVGTPSSAWVSDTMTGELTQVKVEGDGIVDYKQKFIITHVFRQSPIWKKDYLSNFLGQIAPAEFLQGKHLKHIFRVDGKFDFYSADVAHTGSIVAPKGATSWFDQTSTQGKPEYSITSIEYKDHVADEVINQINGSIVTRVTMTVQSRSGRFVAGTTKFVLSHFLCPLDSAEYVNTETTMLQNIREDEKLITMDAAAVDGDNFGTDYQSITDITAEYMAADTAVIIFLVDYSATTKTILSTRAETDRYYGIVLSCQDIAVTTSKSLDRVNVLADFRLADYDLREPANLELIDYIHCYQYPNYGVMDKNTVAGYQGDLAYVEVPFRLESSVVNNISPMLQSATVQIVATKEGEADFILEEKSFDTSSTRKLNTEQDIDIEDSRGFILAQDSPWNRANIVKYSDGNDGTMLGYKIQYGFVHRYESWIPVVQPGEGDSYDVFKNIEAVVHAWGRYSQGNGWALKFRVTFNVKGYSGFVTTSQTETDMVTYPTTSAPEQGVTYKTAIKYFDEDGNESPGIISGTVTRIVTRFYGEVGNFPVGFEEYYGMITADTATGSIFTRRLASSDLDSEPGSPFSTVDLPANNAISSIESNALRMSRFSNRIELDTWYTDQNRGLGDIVQQLLIGFRLGHQGPSILLNEDGSALLQEDGSLILL